MGRRGLLAWAGPGFCLCWPPGQTPTLPARPPAGVPQAQLPVGAEGRTEARRGGVWCQGRPLCHLCGQLSGPCVWAWPCDRSVCVAYCWDPVLHACGRQGGPGHRGPAAKVILVGTLSHPRGLRHSGRGPGGRDPREWGWGEPRQGMQSAWPSLQEAPWAEWALAMPSQVAEAGVGAGRRLPARGPTPGSGVHPLGTQQAGVTNGAGVRARLRSAASGPVDAALQVFPASCPQAALPRARGQCEGQPAGGGAHEGTGGGRWQRRGLNTVQRILHILLPSLEKCPGARFAAAATLEHTLMAPGPLTCRLLCLTVYL